MSIPYINSRFIPNYFGPVVRKHQNRFAIIINVENSPVPFKPHPKTVTQIIQKITLLPRLMRTLIEITKQLTQLLTRTLIKQT